eukprot:GCRY01002371.1.p1 GENE.GCRY01002371.1~~GCRY01002371.1.p1  ORF type:complete len:207 (+),score=27.14 GCRY01002371.1:133-753(+)
MSIVQAKRSLRKTIASLLKEKKDLTKESVDVYALVSKLSIFQSAKNISCYVSMPESELQTNTLLEDILGQNQKALFIPRCTGPRAMDMLQISSLDDLKLLPKNKWNIPEPTSSEGRRNALDSGLDLIFVPGVAFDKTGGRLGHGKGFYDTFIETVRQRGSKPCLIGLALREQLVDHVPRESFDELVDYVVTPEGVIDCAEERARLH